jgi:hypothetical protein
MRQAARMRVFVAFLLVVLPGPLLAQQDDGAHRADRQRTVDLNRNAARALERRDARNDAAVQRYRDAMAAYERRREAWRRQFEACQDGDDRACAPE